MTDLPLNHNFPPPEVPQGELPPATFVLKRATGEIEIRGRNMDFINYEQMNHPDYLFRAPVQINEKLWAVTGIKETRAN